MITGFESARLEGAFNLPEPEHFRKTLAPVRVERVPQGARPSYSLGPIPCTVLYLPTLFQPQTFPLTVIKDFCTEAFFFFFNLLIRFYLFIYFNIFIGVKLLYSGLLVSAV